MIKPLLVIIDGMLLLAGIQSQLQILNAFLIILQSPSFSTLLHIFRTLFHRCILQYLLDCRHQRLFLYDRHALMRIYRNHRRFPWFIEFIPNILQGIFLQLPRSIWMKINHNRPWMLCRQKYDFFLQPTINLLLFYCWRTILKGLIVVFTELWIIIVYLWRWESFGFTLLLDHRRL